MSAVRYFKFGQPYSSGIKMPWLNDTLLFSSLIQMANYDIKANLLENHFKILKYAHICVCKSV